MIQADTLVLNASHLVTLAGPNRPRKGKEMGEIGIIDDGALAIGQGKIIETGTSQTIKERHNQVKHIIDAHGLVVMPGFIDAHTHLVFAGSREYEMELRLSGTSYLDILKLGGGIHATVRATRDLAKESLLTLARLRLKQLIEHGTTTLEIKTGYGLDRETEEKMLLVISQLKLEEPVDIISTFLGAHAVPVEKKREEYLHWLINEAPALFQGKAEFWDVFCEQGAYSPDESINILQSAKAAGYKLKIHAGQFNDLGVVDKVAELGAVSADHLDVVSDEQLDTMAKHGTIAVLLPGVPFYLDSSIYPEINRFTQAQVPIALATDFNPGSCPSFSMPMMIALACLQMKMSAAEAITASTINAAWALDRGDTLGSLEPGKQADLIILDINHPSQLPYFFGTNLVNTVIKKGRTIWQKTQC